MCLDIPGPESWEIEWSADILAVWPGPAWLEGYLLFSESWVNEHAPDQWAGTEADL